MSVASALAGVLERRLAALHRHLPGALSGDVTSVHQARVASRRLRETLPVLAAIDSHDTVAGAARAIRRVTQALGPVRELDVSLDVLSNHLATHPEEASEIAIVRAWIERLRSDRREAMLEALTERRLSKLWRRVDALRALASAAEPGDSRWKLVLGARIAARAEDLGRQMAATGILYASEPLHTTRIATKKLRYAVELAQDLGLADAQSVLRALKRQQEVLGRIHDLEVLASLADQACAAVNRPVQAARLVGDWHRECRELHAVYVRRRPTVERMTARVATVLPRRVARRRAVGRPPAPRGVPSRPKTAQ